MRTRRRLARRALPGALAGILVAVFALAGQDGGGLPPATPRVEIYTTPSCPYCKALRAYLAARDIPFVEHNVNATLESRAAFYASGAHGVPLTVIDGQRIQGFNPLRIEAALDAARAAAAQSSAPP